MIIGLCGFIGAGKGTVADILIDKYGFTKISFADALKDAAAQMFGWPRHLLEGDTEESRVFRETKDEWWSEKFGYDFSPRKALQLIGTEGGRNVFHQDVWVFSAFRRITPGKLYVIPDVRFVNEIKFIHDHGGFVVRVRRGQDPEWYETALTENRTDENALWMLEDRNELMEQKYPDVHSSEWNWIGTQFQYTLHNESTLDMLDADISHMLKVFEGPRETA